MELVELLDFYCNHFYWKDYFGPNRTKQISFKKMRDREEFAMSNSFSNHIIEMKSAVHKSTAFDVVVRVSGKRDVKMPLHQFKLILCNNFVRNCSFVCRFVCTTQTFSV